MDFTKEVEKLIGSSESMQLEYKSVLPPSKTVARIIASFSNSEGGYLILGVTEDVSGIRVIGLSEDFHAVSITNKALELLSPKPVINYQYFDYQGKKLFVIKTEKSQEEVKLENKVFFRKGSSVEQLHPVTISFKSRGYPKIKKINSFIDKTLKSGTSSQNTLFEHYQSILKIMDDLGDILYPVKPEMVTTNQEGKVLTRILFSSFVDSFETYLSELLYEIFLAKPSTLKSKQQVTIEEVLNCSDIQEFIQYWAKQKIGKLQKGSVRGFIKETKQISDLNVLDKNQQDEIERILQIRHLYTHRNGIVDEKFLVYFPSSFALNAEHQMTVSDVCDKMEYLLERVNELDKAAIKKYSLATLT